MPIVVGVLVAYGAILLTGAALTLESPGGSDDPGTVVSHVGSWFPPGERSTVLANGREVSVVQPWHDAPVSTVLLALGTGLAAAGLCALPILIIFGAATPHGRREAPVSVS